jgi:alpha-tubulin suppressor-like RCC1 family protein
MAQFTKSQILTLFFLVGVAPLSLESCVQSPVTKGDDSPLGGDSPEGSGGNEAGPSSGGGNSGGVCKKNSDCDDGKYCNGAEVCDPEASSAGEDGCSRPPEGPCGDAACDEDSESCGDDCSDPDSDGDSHDSEACGGDDCDDDDPDRFPGNVEICDFKGHDEDCDKATLGGEGDSDRDTDGFVSDQCCFVDSEGKKNCGEDCNDDPDEGEGINPGTPESCNEVDDNCDGIVDKDEDGKDQTVWWYPDFDGDGYGRLALPIDEEPDNEDQSDEPQPVRGCFPPSQTDEEIELFDWVDLGNDCVDDPLVPNAAAIHPGAKEVCNESEQDEDCDDTTDEGCPCLPVGDERPCGAKDGAGNFLEIGACKSGKQVCLDTGWAEGCTGSIGPSDEVCSDEDPACSDPNECDDDEDCNGIIDGFASNYDMKATYYRDDDEDQFGQSGDSQFLCAISGSYTATAGGDCNDSAQAVNPTATEVCNNVDDNCDGIIDGEVVENDLKNVYYRDHDGDQYGQSSDSQLLCSSTGEYTATVGGDCVDTTGGNTVNPAAPEVCNGKDDNCDNITDGTSVTDDLKGTYYRDGDGDGYTTAQSAKYCAGTQPSGWLGAATAVDCADSDANRHPGATESCDGVDQDCDGADTQDPDAAAACGTPGQVATATCNVNACDVLTCNGAYLDCDSAFNCETNGATSMTHCGQCNNACSLACTSSSCEEVSKMSAGLDHSCAVTSKGRVACWGKNDKKQVVNVADGSVLTPEAVTLPVTPAYEVAAGSSFTCAIVGGSRQVACWGANESAQTAQAASTTTAIPTLVDEGSVSGVSKLAAGSLHACAALTSGAVYCWGRRAEGELGNGSTAGAPPCSPSCPTPYVANATQVQLSTGGALANVVDISAGQYHTCALTNTGAVYCWGANDQAQVGTGATSAAEPLAKLVSGITASQISAGSYHTCAVVSSRPRCWGDNSFSQTGQAGAGPILTPTQVSGIADAIEVAAGGFHTCVRRTGGAVACFGNNSSGERGDVFPAAASTTLVTVSSLSATSVVAGRGAHNCAIGTGSAGYCWGLNDNGRLGNGTSTSNRVPQKISPLD